MADCLLGHRNEDSICKMAKELGWTITRGTLKPCKHCRKESIMPKTDIPGHKIYLDLSKVMIKTEASLDTTISRDNWKVLVCEVTGKKWSDFTVTKSEMVEHTCEHLYKMKSRGIPVCYIQLDPAGENHKLVRHAGSSEWAALQPLDFEFTS